jgi:hypothetical protein
LLLLWGDIDPTIYPSIQIGLCLVGASQQESFHQLSSSSFLEDISGKQ